MPVSPQDFELYSRMTGAPMPTDAMSRMQMAPEVFKFTKDFAKKPNILEKTGNLVKNIGRNTLVGAGLLAGMDLENQQRQQQELMRSEADKAQSEAVTMNDPVEEVASEPELTAMERAEAAKQKTAKVKTDEGIRLLEAKAKLRNIAEEKLDTPIDDQNRLEDLKMLAAKVKSTENPRLSEIFARNFGESAGSIEVEDAPFQEPTTADSYGQDYVPNQTASNIVDRKITQGSQIADSTPNIAEVLSENQDSQPPEGMVGGEGKNQLEKFLSQKGLDQALLGAIGERMTPEPRIGDSSPLVDHPDLPGGEDDINLPSGTNTSPTTDLEDHYSEMRRMDAEERRGKAKIDRRVGKNLLEQRAIANQEAIDSGFMSMSDEERANETARLGGDRIREMAKTSPDAISGTDLKRTGLLSGQLTRFPAGEETEKATERKRLRRERNANMSTSEKADDFTAKFVEGAKSDIVRGARGNKSLGITRIPATNGDAQVGFVLANKPLDQSPKFATTYGFGVAPGAESLLDNQLNKDSFSDYMKRGMSEAKQGKKRKAGEIFEYLPQSARVVGGTASLGDIVM